MIVVNKKFVKCTLVILIVLSNSFQKSQFGCNTFDKFCFDQKSLSSETSESWSDLQQISGWSLNPGAILDVVTDGNFFYFVGGDKELFVLDVSNQNFPQIIGSFDSNCTRSQKIAFEKNCVYIVKDNNVLDLVDVTNKSKPVLAGQYEVNDTITEILSIENSLILAKNSSEIELLGKNNLGNLTLISTIASNESVIEQLACSGNLLITANGYNGLSFYNISDKRNPYRVTNYTTGSYFSDVTVFGDIVIANDNSTHLSFLNISDLANIQKFADYWLNSTVKKLHLAENFSLVATEKYLLNLDYTNHSNVTFHWSFETERKIISFGLMDNLLVVVEEFGNELLQISPIENPVLVHRFGYNQIRNVYIYDDLIIGVYLEEGVVILNKTSSNNLEFVSYFRCEHQIMDICIKNNFLYCAVKNQGLLVVNISNITTPHLVGSYFSSGDSNSICCFEEYVFLADGGESFQVIDFSDYLNPDQLKSTTVGYLSKIALFDGIVFMIDDSSGLGLYLLEDVINPDLILRARASISRANYYDVVAADNKFYTGLGTFLYVYDYSDLNNLVMEKTLANGPYYDLSIGNERLYSCGANKVQFYGLKTLKSSELVFDDCYFRDIVVDKEFILLANSLKGDDIMLFNHSLDQKVSTGLWWKITIPAVGVTGIAIGLIVYFVFRKKRAGENLS